MFTSTFLPDANMLRYVVPVANVMLRRKCSLQHGDKACACSLRQAALADMLQLKYHNGNTALESHVQKSVPTARHILQPHKGRLVIRAIRLTKTFTLGSETASKVELQEGGHHLHHFAVLSTTNPTHVLQLSWTRRHPPLPQNQQPRVLT